jgi:flagellar assembly protein FliH
LSSILTADAALKAERWFQPLFDVPDDTLPPHSARHLDEIEKTAYEDGHARGQADGRAQGYAEGLAEVQAAAERLQQLLARFGRPLQALDEEVERLLVAMALDVGRRLAQQALEADPAGVLAIVRSALAALGQPVREARIHLHPDDLSLLQAHPLPGVDGAGVQLVADTALGRGDCRVVTDSVQVDARMDTREACLARALLGDPR